VGADDDGGVLPAAELEDRIMNLSVCRSSAVTVSEGVLKQQLSQARSEAELLKQEVARLKEELDRGMQARALPLLPTPQEAAGKLAEVKLIHIANAGDEKSARSSTSF
jgi:hypothetical protein